ncbi:outer membrane beta-barrel protein [Legionella sp. PATHC035]|uniref:outer membrane protein n=1 Tax=Legionella sp. PATHC035 TaxID=2992040 RepID=UPI0022444AAB|nr:outer membrane beta-barrel protein [Legionella sp. PATHC035]MCW8408821.1 outer membrane beta-barrel protein [Legionella sp. PATHC035]
MSARSFFFSLASCFALSSLASAGSMGSIAPVQGFHPVFTLFGGVAGLDAKTNSPQTFSGTDDEQFLYVSKKHNQTTGFVGGFLGTEYQLPHPGLFLQAGVEYDYFGNAWINGQNAVGIEPDTSTLYNYSWRIQTQQVLAVAKLFTTTELTFGAPHQLFPYLSVGLGAAFNNANEFSTMTEETGSINLTPTFNDHTHSAFSYTLGVGVDTSINQQMRFGVGYRFSDFGKSSLDEGQVVFQQYKAPVPFALSTAHTYANQFMVQLSYVA